MQINWEIMVIVLSLVLLFGFGFFAGVLVASRLDLHLKISKKEDYEAKVKELDRMMESLKQETQTEEDLSKQIKAFELFPEDINRDFGLPRELR